MLDDRSLNGVYVNGERVEWSALTDGDEITIGRHAIYFLDTATVGSASPPAGRARRVTSPKASGDEGARLAWQAKPIPGAIVRAPWPRRSPSCR